MSQRWSSILPQPGESHAELARYSLTYLSCENIRCVKVSRDHEESTDRFEMHLKNWSFLAYASTHWWQHLHASVWTSCTKPGSSRSGCVSNRIETIQTLLRFVTLQRFTVHWLQIFGYLRFNNADFSSFNMIGEIAGAFQHVDSDQDFEALWSWLDHLGPYSHRLIYFVSSCFPIVHQHPIHIAARFDQAQFLREELNNGTDIETIDADGNSALHFAANGVSFACTELLISRKACVNKQNDKGETPLICATLGWVSYRQTSPGSFRCVELLLNATADADLKDSRGCTPLRYLIQSSYPRDEEKVPLAKFLLHHTRDIEALDDGPTSFPGVSSTLLDIAAEYNAAEIAKLLIAQGADPAQSIFRANKSEVASVLVNEIQDINCVTPKPISETMIHLNTPNGPISIKNPLPAHFDGTVLHHAARHKNDLGELFLLAGANPNIVDKHGRLPLHYAMENHDTQLIFDLLAHNSIWDVKDNFGQMPQDYPGGWVIDYILSNRTPECTTRSLGLIYENTLDQFVPENQPDWHVEQLQRRLENPNPPRCHMIDRRRW